MLASQEHLAVNWIDGMKVNSQQFIDQENWIQDQIRDSNGLRLTDFNFGILPPVEEGQSSLEIDVNIDESEILKIDLLQCRAITWGGQRIEITRKMAQKQNLPLNAITRELDLEKLPQSTI